MGFGIFKSAGVGLRESKQDMHRHKYAELYVSLEGRTTDVVNGQQSRTLPLDVFVLTRDVTHGQIDTDGYRYCIFQFDMDALVRALGDAALCRGFQDLFIIDPSLRREGEQGENMCIDALTAQYAENAARILSDSAEGITADAMFVSLALLISDVAKRRSGGARDVVAEALFYMNIHYGEPISVSDMAARFGYSQRHFTRLFTAFTGLPPVSYLADLRLKRAAFLLSEGDMTVTEIAERVGMCDGSAFTKRFRQRYAMTPTEYRKHTAEK